MRKDALTLTISTVVAGIFGGFFRWLQLQNAFEPLSGLAVRGAATTVVLTVFTVIAAGFFAAAAYIWLARYEQPGLPAEAFRAATPVPRIIFWAAGILLAADGVFLMLFASLMSRYPSLQRLCAVFAILAGLSLPLLASGKPGEKEKRAAAVMPVLFCCMLLILWYKNNAEDPTIWHYLPEILAICGAVLASYELAAYFYGKARPKLTVFCCQLAAYLGICALSDSQGLAARAIFAVSALLFLTAEYLLIANMREGKHQSEE